MEWLEAARASAACGQRSRPKAPPAWELRGVTAEPSDKAPRDAPLDKLRSGDAMVGNATVEPQELRGDHLRPRPFSEAPRPRWAARHYGATQLAKQNGVLDCSPTTKIPANKARNRAFGAALGPSLPCQRRFRAQEGAVDAQNGSDAHQNVQTPPDFGRRGPRLDPPSLFS